MRPTLHYMPEMLDKRTIFSILEVGPMARIRDKLWLYLILPVVNLKRGVGVEQLKMSRFNGFDFDMVGNHLLNNIL
jgi:hypothetical protein